MPMFSSKTLVVLAYIRSLMHFDLKTTDMFYNNEIFGKGVQDNLPMTKLWSSTSLST